MLRQAWVEEKGLAVAVHTRRLADPAAAFERLLPVLREAARARDLEVEPGRNVIEVRAPGMHKGMAVHRLAEDLQAKAFAFVGDDLGDIEAFKAVEELRRQGMPGLLICSGSEEETTLVELADLVVDGPDGVLAAAAGAHRRHPLLPRLTPSSAETSQLKRVTPAETSQLKRVTPAETSQLKRVTPAETPPAEGVTPPAPRRGSSRRGRAGCARPRGSRRRRARPDPRSRRCPPRRAPW